MTIIRYVSLEKTSIVIISSIYCKKYFFNKIHQH
jgi:hypothetical protein